jgi:cell wall-associated NlpC family hydrolase
VTSGRRRHPLLTVGLAACVALAGLIGVVAGFAIDQLEVAQPAAATPLASTLLPPGWLASYQQAAAGCPGLDWTILAAVGTVESGNGANNGPSPAGAVGPMQFLPATFAAYDHPVPADSEPTPVPPGAQPPTPWDPVDAIWAAARLLCSVGVATSPHDALIAYNCGNPRLACQAASAGYATTVLGLAARLGVGGLGPTSPGAQVVTYAQSQLGVPYRWGGETPGIAFDCSGLAQWAWAQVGVVLPRNGQLQYDAGPHVPPAQPLEAGDLVFFGAAPTQIGHVGIYLGDNRMIDAPHSGAVVRVDGFDPTPGARWGGDLYIGATRPSIHGPFDRLSTAALAVSEPPRDPRRLHRLERMMESCVRRGCIPKS